MATYLRKKPVWDFMAGTTRIVPSFLVVIPNDTVPAIEDKVKETVAKHLEIDKRQISLSSDLVRDLGADSLNVIEIVLKLEKEFGIRFIDNELNNLKKVGDFVTVIEKRKKVSNKTCKKSPTVIDAP